MWAFSKDLWLLIRSNLRAAIGLVPANPGPVFGFSYNPLILPFKMRGFKARLLTDFLVKSLKQNHY